MHSDGKGEGRESNSVPVNMRPNKACFESKGQREHNQELFPRLPNEITFGQIVPKLPWNAFHNLAAVSRAWRKAILDHRIYDARVHSNSTDTLVVHGHDYAAGAYNVNVGKKSARIAVYSVRDRLCYKLPPIPGHYRGIPASCACVSLDGRIYVLGGAVQDRGPRAFGPYSANSSSKVYVLDLAGASHWNECASMERGRREFGCAVLDGKIYVFGGTHNFGPARGAEVYNPKVNAWSPIAPMTSFRFRHRVSTLTQEIFVYDGEEFNPCVLSWIANGTWNSPSRINGGADLDSYMARRATSVEIYNPVKDEWTVDNRMGELNDEYLDTGILFVVQGKFHRIREEDISVLENDGQWTCLKQNEFPGGTSVQRVFALKVNDELLAGVERYDQSDPEYIPPAIYQSQGFGNENRKLVWKGVSKCPGVFDFMYCIQL